VNLWISELRCTFKNIFIVYDQCKIAMTQAKMDYRLTMAKSLILCGPNSNTNPKNRYSGFVYKGLFFCKNNNLINGKHVNLPILCPSPNVWDVDEKRLHWASIVRASNHQIINESNLALLWLSTYDTNVCN
jgi:hypothetical protein